jgi:MGT family glycosyltransferase
MTSRRAVAFSIPAHGHTNRMLPVVAGLCEMGIPVDFYAHEMSRRAIEPTGARFVNIYDGRDMDFPDGESLPLPMRNVGFAGYWADDIVRQVAAADPGLVLHDTMAVIGRVVAYHLGIPRVDIRAHHNLQPKRMMAALQASGSLRISEACLASVEMLRHRHGMPDASPFCYFIDETADLNICSEPPEFIPAEDRATFEPLAFFGSYWPGAEAAAPTVAEPFGPDAASRLRVFASLGTAAWMMLRADQTIGVLETIADAVSSYPNARGLISLGNPSVPAALVERLRRPNLRIEPFVNQIDVLRQASVFITHNGLNSTHEAIIHGVPMISCPMFSDQPVMAARLAELGLSVPLVPGGGRPPSVADVHAALQRVQAAGPALRARLAEARDWERAVMAGRPAVLRRIAALLG